MSSSLSCRRPVIRTLAPWAAYSLAAARPMPAAPPVMITVFSENFGIILSHTFESASPTTDQALTPWSRPARSTR
ncbi:Uncharacterised protein [Mycobacteroides abscessus subsp. abscessus]|nr:Uncharacterised protein [Mycobacteroides abscessus subsp. abscessus]